ncbi:hypothetical protein OUQ99_17205 [Streptomonospora nanhaiensis]|uniref:Transposase n=1 Tax=Streptomonospora nanhaiensis TaxID=1323731 RepID=A0ABY6YW56_9ACTN|nr:hypothetical protein [Streptomonospora nanhaiensis]WAE76643.1 hypothetical protein OUQ99_17205 [Streptomonospora nanhaiensis]
MARLVAADDKTVREVIHAFNTQGLACLGPQWAGGVSPPAHPRRGRPRHPDGHHPPGQARPALHPLVAAQARRPPGPPAWPGPAHRPRDPADPAAPPPHRPPLGPQGCVSRSGRDGDSGVTWTGEKTLPFEAECSPCSPEPMPREVMQ